MKVQIKILSEFYYEESNGMLLNPLPGYATEGSAGLDLICTEDVKLYPNERKKIGTGLALWLGAYNTSVAGFVFPRSGLGTRGLVLANTVGVIDEDYQGELIVSAWNNTSDNSVIELKAGHRFAQLVLIPIIKAQFEVVREFTSTTHRESGSFGSTNQ
jgi:dUTP pyrophosphatase